MMEEAAEHTLTPQTDDLTVQQRTLFRRIRERFRRHSVWEHLLGFWVASKITKSGVLAVVPGFPLPKIVNRGGEIITGNIQLYPGVRLEVGAGGVIRIGKGTFLNRHVVVVADTLVDIGRFCGISWDVVIMDTDQHKLDEVIPMTKPVVIEDNVLIGCRSIILKGVRIGHDAVVAAGSVVTRDVAPATVVGGVPARFLFKRSIPT